MVKVCATCGHPLPEIEAMVGLTEMQGRMFFAIFRAGRRGISGYDIVDDIYDGHPPATALKGLSVMKHRMMPKLQKHGLKFVTRAGPNSVWKLEAIGG